MQPDNLYVKREEDKITILEGINQNDSEELRKKMLLLDMHKKKAMRHEPYLETNNKRPGAALGTTSQE